MTHLLESCPPYCLADSSNANEKKFACNECWRVVGMKTPLTDKQKEEVKKDES